MRDIGEDRGVLDALGAADRDMLDDALGLGGAAASRPGPRRDWRAGRSAAAAWLPRRRGATAPRPGRGTAPGPASRRSRADSRFVKARLMDPHSAVRHSSFGARPVRRPPSFRKDSAEPGRSRWSGASAPGPKPAQAEIRRPGPAHRAAAPKQLRMHSTEDARRRGVESEKGWPAQCLRKVQPPD